ncbi:MAG: tetratricopeptide repeat protein, partial [Smithellaceae bacterium]|nr:tetratricopeptide repeat protein [Smithellaceae bacterium]
RQLEKTAGEERREVLARIASEERHFKANILYEKGVRLFKDRGDYDAAEKALSESIALNPRFALAYVQRAFVRFNRISFREEGEDIQPALEDMEQALALEPKKASFYMDRARILRGGQGCDRETRTTCLRVLADMDRAIALEPRNTWFRVTKGGLLAEIERVDEAIAEMDEALKIGIEGSAFRSDLSVLGAYMLKTRLLWEKRELKQAIAVWDRALQLADTPSFLTTEDRQALDILRSMYKESPQEMGGPGLWHLMDETDEHVSLEGERVRALIMKKFAIPPEKAKAEIPRTIEMIQGSLLRLQFMISAHERKSWLLLEAEEYQQARAAMEAACLWDSLGPEPKERIPLCVSPRFEEELARTYSPAGRWLQIGANITDEWQSGAQTRQGKPETYGEAMAAYDQAIALNPRYPEAYQARCHLRQLGGVDAWNEALIADCSEAIHLNPLLLPARMTRAEVYIHLGKKEKALEDYGEILKQGSNAGGARSQRLLLLRELGRTSEALAEVDRYIGSFPEETEWHRARAEMCEEVGRLKEALDSWRTYLKLREERDRRYRKAGEEPSDEVETARERIRLLREQIR